jgi:hypothetical protein
VRWQQKKLTDMLHSANEKLVIPDSNWEDTNAKENEAYTVILIYMAAVNLPTLEYYFYQGICVFTI